MPSPPENPQPTAPLLALPPELHLLITPHLPYPDALALKHTHPRFLALIDTADDVRLKIAWLLDRDRRGLELPRRKCVMESDASFCSSGGGQVRRIMAARRRHGECGAGEGGCEVVVGASCGGKRRGGGGRLWGRKNKGKGGEVEGSLVMWAVGLLVTSLVVNLCFAVRLYFGNMHRAV